MAKDEKINPKQENGDISDVPAGIKELIDNILHRVFDIESCARKYCISAVNAFNENAERLKNELSEYQELAKKHEHGEENLVALKGIFKTIRAIERHNNSSPVETLEKGLFIYLFAAFDKYVGDLVSVLYQNNPILYKNLNREISLSEALLYDTMDELKISVLEKEIGALKRKGYVEQFKDLENKFGIKLTKFKDWPLFVECAQRRNLITHNDGEVSRQYLDVCAKVKFDFKKSTLFDEAPSIGDNLSVGAKYLFYSCHIVSEVAVMLGHTLWRKVLKDELKKSDSHLTSVVFNLLHMEDWGKAISLSNFALGLPNITSDEFKRIFTINLAIALIEINKKTHAIKVLDDLDWSATSYDFKIAYAVLTEDFGEACEIMKKMGKEGNIIAELAYHDWPLFKNFRNREDFFDAYYEVYGYPYSAKLNSLAEEKKPDVEKVSQCEPESCSNDSSG